MSPSAKVPDSRLNRGAIKNLLKLSSAPFRLWKNLRPSPFVPFPNIRKRNCHRLHRRVNRPNAGQRRRANARQWTRRGRTRTAKNRNFPRPSPKAEDAGFAKRKRRINAMRIVPQEGSGEIPPRVIGKFLTPRFSFFQKNAHPARLSADVRKPTRKRTSTDRRRTNTQPPKSNSPQQPDTRRPRK